MSLSTRRIGSMESLEQRQLMAGDTLGAAVPDVEPAEMILIRMPNVTGDIVIPATYDDMSEMFVADSFSYEIETEMEANNATDGTFNQSASEGNSVGLAVIDFVETGGGGDTTSAHESLDLAFNEVAKAPMCYLRYKLDRCFVKSWSTSGDADDRPTEEVSFYYNKIAMGYASTIDGDTFQ